MDFSQLKTYLEMSFLGLKWSQYLLILLVCIGMIFVQWLARKIFDHKLTTWADGTESQVDDILVQSINPPLNIAIFSIALSLILHIWIPTKPLYQWIEKASELGLVVAGFWFLYNAVEIVPIYMSRWTDATESTLDDQLLPLTTKVLRVFIWVIGLIMLIQNMGYSVSGIIASVGIGGAAIAFASQDTIANVFGSIKMLLDRPFAIGDWVRSTSGDIEGVVEDIGFLSTRIRTFADSQITVPNNKFANLPIENFSRMRKRRIYVNLGVVYATTTAQMRQICQEIETLLRSHEGIDQETVFVRFATFSDSSLDIMLYFFTKTTVWSEWLDIKEELYLRFKEIIEEAGSSMAFPTQSLHLENIPQGLFHEAGSLTTGDG